MKHFKNNLVITRVGGKVKNCVMFLWWENGLEPQGREDTLNSEKRYLCPCFQLSEWHLGPPAELRKPLQKDSSLPVKGIDLQAENSAAQKRSGLCIHHPIKTPETIFLFEKLIILRQNVYPLFSDQSLNNNRKKITLTLETKQCECFLWGNGYFSLTGKTKGLLMFVICSLLILRQT